MICRRCLKSLLPIRALYPSSAHSLPSCSLSPQYGRAPASWRKMHGCVKRTNQKRSSFLSPRCHLGRPVEAVSRYGRSALSSVLVIVQRRCCCPRVSGSRSKFMEGTGVVWCQEDVDHFLSTSNASTITTTYSQLSSIPSSLPSAIMLLIS